MGGLAGANAVPRAPFLLPGPERLTEQAVEFAPADRVTFASLFLQSLAVEDRDLVAAIRNQFEALEIMRGESGAGAPHARRHRQKLVR